MAYDLRGEDYEEVRSYLHESASVFSEFSTEVKQTRKDLRNELRWRNRAPLRWGLEDAARDWNTAAEYMNTLVSLPKPEEGRGRSVRGQALRCAALYIPVSVIEHYGFPELSPLLRKTNDTLTVLDEQTNTQLVNASKLREHILTASAHPYPQVLDKLVQDYVASWVFSHWRANRPGEQFPWPMNELPEKWPTLSYPYLQRTIG